MNNTVLTDEIIEDLAWENRMENSRAEIPAEVFFFARSIEQAVLQSPEIQALYGLLKESRHQLPLAAQFWNEDEEPERRSRNVKRVMELIARIDAAIEKQP